MDRERRTGETTYLMEQAVRLLSNMPEGHYVYITGAHWTWLKELKHRFAEEGLIGVKFLHRSQILNGALRGCRGALLIDDPRDMPFQEFVHLNEERLILQRRG